MAFARRSSPSHAILLATMAATPLTLADTWDNTAGNAQWSIATNWADSTEPTINDAVTFPSTIPLNRATTTMTTTKFAASLTFNNDYTLHAGQMCIGTGAVNVACGRTATINTVISESGRLAKTGFGTLHLIPTSSTRSLVPSAPPNLTARSTSRSSTVIRRASAKPLTS